MTSCNIYDDVKKEFPVILSDCKGMVASACTKAGIDRSTYYRWRKEDDEFKKKCDTASQLVGDFVEGRLLKLISEDNPAAVIFYCKTKLRDRGYAEYKEEPSELKQYKVSDIDKQIINTYIDVEVEERLQVKLKELGVTAHEATIEVKDD